jgi:hypothetical protein
MAFGYFSNSFFICLGICLLVIGILSFLLSREVLNQNHKITTMCELVTTMAQDLQMLKMQQTVDKIQLSIPQIGGKNNDNAITSFSGNVSEETHNDNKIISGLPAFVSTVSTQQTTNKIIVSDCENTDDDNEDDNEDNSDDDDDTNEPESDDETENNDEYSKASQDEFEYELEQDGITIEETVNNQDFNEDELVSLDGELGGLNEDMKEVETINDINNKLFQFDVQNISTISSEEIIVNKLPSDSEPIKEEDLPIPAIISSPNDGNKDIAIIDDIVLSTPIHSFPTEGDHLEEDNNELNYSKMNIQQLRKIVSDRKLATNPTKLKKQELLQLLTNETTISTNIDI